MNEGFAVNVVGIEFPLIFPGQIAEHAKGHVGIYGGLMLDEDDEPAIDDESQIVFQISKKAFLQRNDADGRAFRVIPTGESVI